MQICNYSYETWLIKVGWITLRLFFMYKFSKKKKRNKKKIKCNQNEKYFLKHVKKKKKVASLKENTNWFFFSIQCSCIHIYFSMFCLWKSINWCRGILAHLCYISANHYYFSSSLALNSDMANHRTIAPLYLCQAQVCVVLMYGRIRDGKSSEIEILTQTHYKGS